MDDVLARMWEDLVGRLSGPLTLRLMLQPLMAAILATKDGLRDARLGAPPFFWAVLNDPGHRRDLLRNGWTSIAKVFSVAVLLDAVYQFIALRWFYPGEALIVACILAIVPYLVIRGPANRLARASRQPEKGTLQS
jgi:hypothetical protein